MKLWTEQSPRAVCKRNSLSDASLRFVVWLINNGQYENQVCHAKKDGLSVDSNCLGGLWLPWLDDKICSKKKERKSDVSLSVRGCAEGYLLGTDYSLRWKTAGLLSRGFSGVERGWIWVVSKPRCDKLGPPRTPGYKTR
jgi:hypothetical protein